MVPWAHLSPRPKWHLRQFSRVCRPQDCDRPTDGWTDHATPSVTIDRIYTVVRCGPNSKVCTIVAKDGTNQ